MSHAGKAGTAPPVTIVGAGNWLLAIDRVGPLVLESIEGRYGPEVELCALGSGGLALLDHLRGQDLLLVVDACISGRAPGEVFAVEPDLEATTTRETSVHQIGPLEALVIAKLLFSERLPRRVRLLLVETEGIDEALERRACERVIALLDEEVELWRAGARRTGANEQKCDERELNRFDRAAARKRRRQWR